MAKGKYLPNDLVTKADLNGDTSFIDEDQFNINAGYLSHFFRCQQQWLLLDIDGEGGELDTPNTFRRKHKLLKVMINLLSGKFISQGKYQDEINQLKTNLKKISRQTETVFANYDENNGMVDKRLLLILDENYDEVFNGIIALLEKDGMLTRKSPDAKFAIGDM